MNENETKLLKKILENLHHPEALDAHPWVCRPFTRDAIAGNHKLQEARPGEQLVGAIVELFPKMMPSTPPRRGKRLDTRWGEFGILAAQYFAPLQFGTPIPSSLRDAWGRIDQVIQLYVFGRNGNSLSEKEALPYKLVGDEPEIAPVSTLSDWHCKGIERLADTLLAHEQYLEKLPLQPSVTPAVHPGQPSRASSHRRPSGSALSKALRALLILVTASLVIALILGGLKGKRMYDLALVLKQDAGQVRALVNSSPDIEQVKQAGPTISKLRGDFEALRDEAEPLLWLGPWLEWVPVYGGDLAASRQVLRLADRLLESVEKSYQAIQPLLIALEGGEGVDPQQLVALLNQAEPELRQARQAFDEAAALRRELDPARLSPATRLVIERDLDRWMPIMDDGLAVALVLPQFLGATRDGPKTYLILAQNEDELRPTGGFITAAGTMVLRDGRVLNLNFADSGELDHWEMPYPQAPWQLEEYMNSPVLILRDANWFTDFPTTALYAESLYAYHNSHSVDGVIAFDQRMLVLVLEALGPVEVEGAPALIGAGNVISFMRSSKSPPAGQPVPADWSRKGFMDKITNAILAKIFRGDVSWKVLGKAFFQGLNEDHLLLVLDEPVLGEVIARHGWDGALRPGAGDFLMAVDANIGFNKTNAVVETSLFYDVDLTDPARPTGQLTVAHQNHAPANIPCLQWGAPRKAGEEQYPIAACYWNYMRVYKPAGTDLLDASAQSIPAEWTILGHGVDGQVDVLDEEVEGLQAFGTLMVVPGGESLNTAFRFSLPDGVLKITPESDLITYHLDVKKQPGTLALPLTIRIHLPRGAAIHSTSPEAVIEANHLLFRTDLRTDRQIAVVFSPK